MARPIWDSLTASGTSKLTYLESNGILDALIFYALGVVIYLVMRARSRAEGVDSSMLFAEMPDWTWPSGCTSSGTCTPPRAPGASS